MSGSTFFPNGASTPDGGRVVPTTPVGTLDDVHLNSAALSGTNLVLNLNDGESFTVDLSTLNSNTFASGLAFNDSNRQLTLNRSDGQNFSATITSAGDGLASLSLNGTTFILTATLADGTTETVDLSGLTTGAVSINGMEVTNPNFQDSSDIAFSFSGSDVTARLTGALADNQFRGEWDSQTTYEFEDVVFDDQTLDIYILENSSGIAAGQARPALNPTNWVQISNTFRGTWNSASLYEDGTIVESNGDYYLKITNAATDGIGVAVTDTTAWHRLTERGGRRFSLTTTYTGGDIVTSNLRTFIATAGTPTVGTRPENNLSEWKELASNVVIPTTNFDNTINQTTAPSRVVVGNIRDAINADIGNIAAWVDRFDLYNASTSYLRDTVQGHSIRDVVIHNGALWHVATDSPTASFNSQEPTESSDYWDLIINFGDMVDASVPSYPATTGIALESLGTIQIVSPTPGIPTVSFPNATPALYGLTANVTYAYNSANQEGRLTAGAQLALNPSRIDADVEILEVPASGNNILTLRATEVASDGTVGTDLWVANISSPTIGRNTFSATNTNSRTIPSGSYIRFRLELFSSITNATTTVLLENIRIAVASSTVAYERTGDGLSVPNQLRSDARRIQLNRDDIVIDEVDIGQAVANSVTVGAGLNLTTGPEGVRLTATGGGTGSAISVENSGTEIDDDARILNFGTGLTVVQDPSDNTQVNITADELVLGTVQLWDASNTYLQDQLVWTDIPDANIYYAVQGSTGVNPATDADSSHWRILTFDTQYTGETGQINIDSDNIISWDSNALEWEPGSAYVIGDTFYTTDTVDMVDRNILWRVTSDIDAPSGLVTNIPARFNDIQSNLQSIGGSGGVDTNTGVMSVVGDDATAGTLDFSTGSLSRLQVGAFGANINSLVQSNQLNIQSRIQIYNSSIDYIAGDYIFTNVDGARGLFWLAVVANGPTDGNAFQPTANNNGHNGATQVWRLLGDGGGTTPHPHTPSLTFTISPDIFVADSAGTSPFSVTLTENDGNSYLSSVSFEESISGITLANPTITGTDTRTITVSGSVSQIAKQGVTPDSEFYITAVVSGTFVANGVTTNYTNERRTVTCRFISNPTPYYVGTMTESERTSALADSTFATITGLSGMTSVTSDIVLPFTRSFSGEDRYVALLSTATVNRIQSEGFVFTFGSRTGISNGSGTNYNLYVTTAVLSAGTHSVTFR